MGNLGSLEGSGSLFTTCQQPLTAATRARGPGLVLPRRMLSIPGRGNHMNHTTDPTEGALLLALVAAAVSIEALVLLARLLVVHGLALLLAVAGWEPARGRPSTARLSSAPSPAQPPARGHQGAQEAQPAPLVPIAPVEPPAAAGGQLEALPVRELRHLARAAGRRALARSGRRAELLEVLG
ncbi:hypothetical protein KBY66_03150 [Synechococcus sp. Tobar12-5m-g]|uniref:hypothetical protein n=1 Tax=unclassified Synechococcus TaxID=2626047 RepID=UPI0020CDD7D4|nr:MULTISPECIES: hypothetical protein [unclassified Synechococcus]MCP9771629.1 hypothetical protein [Synechococcus sp. Tobar12-5m-g]MCP9872570.1 hypothetical protein [Synechococcus sp. Cruz CV-v-12]